MTGPSGGRVHGVARASCPNMNKDREKMTSNSNIAAAMEEEPRLHVVDGSGGGRGIYGRTDGDVPECLRLNVQS